MKTKDYMVGDWITTEHDFPMRVTAVGKDYLYADFDGNEGDPFEFDEEYLPKPIPLTEEILEKNGFEYFGEMAGGRIQHRLYLQDGKIKIDADPSDLYDLSYDSNIICNMRYVHQLQHALRLCGLNAFADNFKI